VVFFVAFSVVTEKIFCFGQASFVVTIAVAVFAVVFAVVGVSFSSDELILLFLLLLLFIR
jgi:hypothetical protein